MDTAPHPLQYVTVLPGMSVVPPILRGSGGTDQMETIRKGSPWRAIDPFGAAPNAIAPIEDRCWVGAGRPHTGDTRRPAALP